MGFKMHSDSREWFKKITDSKPFATLFDVYHCCLVLGLAAERWEESEGGDEFMDDFIGRYRPYQSLIVGSVVAAVLKRKGIPSTDRSGVSAVIACIVSDDSVRGDLTPEGFKEINGYALGGFNYLRENFDDKPQQAVYFLKHYQDLLKRAKANRGGFQI